MKNGFDILVESIVDEIHGVFPQEFTAEYFKAVWDSTDIERQFNYVLGLMEN